MTPERLRPVLGETRPLADAFAASGRRLYLVGGVVRDLVLGADMDAADLDFTTDATPDQIKRLVGPMADALWTQGERFGTIGAKVGDRTFEITTHRAEAYRPDSRKPDVAFGTDVTEDLARRDFTINAMALDLTASEPQLIDPHGGLEDLLARRLRTPLGPDVSFSDDPLRMMRGARFVARFDLEPAPELVSAIHTMADRLEIVSRERIRDELDKLMVVPDPSAGLWFLVDHGISAMVLPELAEMRVAQDPIHRHKDVLTHTIAVAAKTSPNLVVRLAALFHDVGKPKTRSIGSSGVSFHHHEVVGARMTRDRMRALKYSNQMVDDVSHLVYLHLRFHTYQMGWTDAAVRRFVRDAGPLLDELIELTRCDCTTRNQRKADQLSRRMDELEERIAQVRLSEELSSMRPDLNGADVMAHLGVAPGPVVGRAMAFLLEVRLEEGPLERVGVLERLDAWWADQPESSSM